MIVSDDWNLIEVDGKENGILQQRHSREEAHDLMTSSIKNKKLFFYNKHRREENE
jgi:hypothetical protein